MEPQTLLIGVAGFILSFLVIYLISVFSMREKTFEEVLEEQRKRMEEEERKAKSERRAEKGERKKYRKFKEKPKEKSLSSPPRETQQPPTASNTKVLVPPVTEIVVESVSSTTAVPIATSIKTNSPKSSKKAQKSLSDINNLSGSCSSNPSGKNVKPLVARSSASSVPVCMEETIEKNVQQVTALEKGSSNKSNSSKESKTTRKNSPTKQTSPVLSSPTEQQQKQKPQSHEQQKQKQPQEQQQKQKQPQPQEKQKQKQPQLQEKQKQSQPQEKQKQKQKQPQPQEQQKQKQSQPQEKQKQPQPHEQQKQKQPQPHEQKKQKQPQPQEKQKQKQPQPHEQQKQKQPQPHEQQKQKQPLPHEQQKQKQPLPHEQQKQKQPQPQEKQKQKLQQEQKQQQQELQKQKQQQQQKYINSNNGTNNSQTQQYTKSNVGSKVNTKTSKAAKQNANEALEKQILIVEQNQKIASSNEENATKKLSKKAKKAATTIATYTESEVKSVKDEVLKENFQKRKSGNETTGITQLISSVKGTVLNDFEIQSLLDLLHSKQTKKSQKPDYAGFLEEKEKRIINVTEGEVKAHQVVTELKQKIVNTEKLYENKIKKLMDENKILQSQMKKTQLQYEQNMTALTDQMKQLESNTVTKECYQKIVDEVNKLSVPVIPVIDPVEMASMKQKVQIMEKELSNNVLKLNNSEKKRKKFEDKIKEFEAKTKNENKKLEELNLALKNSNNEKALLAEKSNKASEALKATQTECASLKCQLKDKELNDKEAEKNMLNLSKRVEELEEELGIVKQKNMILLEENKLVREKPVKVEVNLGERQEPAGAPNGDVQQESLACTKVALVEHERLLGEKQSEIVRLTAELGNKETETKARVDEKESEIQTLTTSLNAQIGEIEKLREEIQIFKNRNDELRKRNWKAMAAVENAEKSAVEKVNNAVKNTMQCQSLDKSVLMRIFPDISVTESLEHDIWLKSFEVEAVNYIKGLKEVSESVSKLEKAEMVKKELVISELEKKLSEAQISKSESVEDLHKQIDTLTAQLKDSTLKKTKLEDRLKELESAFSETKTLCMSLKEKLENAPINNSTEEYEKQVETLMVQLKESNETVDKLETQVKKYQNLLKVTDDKLQVLQRSVEDEELKWRREQQTLQKSLLEAQQELELRKNQVDQTSAQSLEAVNSQTEKEYKLLRLQVEDDEKKVRDLSQTIVKLNGIIKTGQDALSQEQELVCKLKQQLADKNSTELPSAAQEVEELKKKLAQKEKEVEQGQLYNNALSQKLASTVSSNDVGTSV